jgi:hypothetical protein
MKICFLFIWMALAARIVHSQGFIVDQQSTNLVDGSAPLNIIGQPMGQSFRPQFNSIGFVTLNLFDADAFQNNFGASVYVNVRSNSVTGLILGTSATVFMPGQFFGITNFLFSAPVSLVSGATYYLQPVVQTGFGWGSYITDGSYAGGSLIRDGTPFSGRNLWFQEGVIGTPEPSSLALASLSCLLLGSRVWRRR